MTETIKKSDLKFLGFKFKTGLFYLSFEKTLFFTL